MTSKVQDRSSDTGDTGSRKRSAHSLRSLAARVVPWVLWQFRLYRPADRSLLEDVILEYYRGRPEFRRILLVGVGSYVSHYPKKFPGQLIVTIDMNPRRATYGAPHHIVDRIESLGLYFAPGFFDLIVMNGVIGWGLNDLASVETAVSVCHQALRGGGELILSTDQRKPCHGQLDRIAALRAGFTATLFPPLSAQTAATSVPWHPLSEHVFYFYRNRSESI